ncbi:MAG: hydroxymethylbilane synthase [Planctomycetes bacterium GWF2_50_10]|nr:MAG: hydroxymethylbilane synthase [Planctomycetes bacterium GWF2_50_10]
MTRLRIATRASELAKAQSRFVRGLLESLTSEVEFELVEISTAGDQDRSVPLWKLEGTGFFTTQIENALKEGLADIAVHSFKDLPTCCDAQLTVAVVCDRKFVEDVVIARGKGNLRDLAAGARVGTSSLRRIAQLKRFYPNLEPVTIRGNVPGRIAKVDQGQYDAIILARAGLERLRLAHRITQVLDADQFIPAPAQGALAIQTRVDDEFTRGLVTRLDDRASRITAQAERMVLEILEGGCHAPVGVRAVITGEDITITAFLADIDGSKYLRDTVRGRAECWQNLAVQLGQALLGMGGREILEGITKI